MWLEFRRVLFRSSLSVAKILELMEDNILKDQRRAEWRMLGALIDRILLIVLITAATSTTLYIYVIAPVVNQIQKTDIEWLITEIFYILKT